MGPKKKYLSQQIKNDDITSKQSNTEKKLVNLLPVYTIYKQKFRRISEDQFKTIISDRKTGKRTAKTLCQEFMKSKNVGEDVSFENNNGFLSLPRFIPLVALVAERSGFKHESCLINHIDFSCTPKRFREKFKYLLVYGFWFLGKVISDSLSEKDQVNRGNMFSFAKGDLGFWWAGVKILDWNHYLIATNRMSHTSCSAFVIEDPPRYRFHMRRALFNMNQPPSFFLSEEDWNNFTLTIKHVKEDFFNYKYYSEDDDWGSNIGSDFGSNLSFSPVDSNAQTLSSRNSVASLVSYDSVD